MGCGGMLRSHNSPPTVRDYRTGTGEEGRFQFELKVSGRGGEPRVRCGKKLVTTHTIDLRATTFCPTVPALARARFRVRHPPCPRPSLWQASLWRAPSREGPASSAGDHAGEKSSAGLLVNRV